jgi:1-deoxy-D-xylulose-5-phosphate synthase
LPAKDHGEGVYELKKGEKLVVFSFGSIAGEVQEAMEGLPLAHYNLNVLKTFPARVIAEIVHHYDLIVTIEENSPRGGLGDTLRAALSERNIAKSVISRSIPDQFIAHASRSELLEQIGLDPMSIREFLMASLRQ